MAHKNLALLAVVMSLLMGSTPPADRVWAVLPTTTHRYWKGLGRLLRGWSVGRQQRRRLHRTPDFQDRNLVRR